MCLLYEDTNSNFPLLFVFLLHVGAHELTLFKKFYSKLRNLDLAKLTAYFVGKEIIDFEDEEKIFNATTVPEKSSIILRKVFHHLQRGVTKSLFAMLDIIRQRGDIVGKEVAQQMRQELLFPQGIIHTISIKD